MLHKGLWNNSHYILSDQNTIGIPWPLIDTFVVKAGHDVSGCNYMVYTFHFLEALDLQNACNVI